MTRPADRILLNLLEFHNIRKTGSAWTFSISLFLFSWVASCLLGVMGLFRLTTWIGTYMTWPSHHISPQWWWWGVKYRRDSIWMLLELTRVHMKKIANNNNNVFLNKGLPIYIYIYIYIYIEREREREWEMVDFAKSDKMIKISGKMNKPTLTTDSIFRSLEIRAFILEQSNKTIWTRKR